MAMKNLKFHNALNAKSKKKRGTWSNYISFLKIEKACLAISSS